jgi:hypothetical protein
MLMRSVRVLLVKPPSLVRARGVRDWSHRLDVAIIGASLGVVVWLGLGLAIALAADDAGLFQPPRYSTWAVVAVPVWAMSGVVCWLAFPLVAAAFRLAIEKLTGVDQRAEPLPRLGDCLSAATRGDSQTLGSIFASEADEAGLARVEHILGSLADNRGELAVWEAEHVERARDGSAVVIATGGLVSGLVLGAAALSFILHGAMHLAALSFAMLSAASFLVFWSGCALGLHAALRAAIAGPLGVTVSPIIGRDVAFTPTDAVVIVEGRHAPGLWCVRLFRRDGVSRRLVCSTPGFEHLITCWAAHARADAESDDV